MRMRTMAALALGAGAAAGAALADDGAFGFWRVESGAAVVEIAPCGEAACGRIVGLRDPLGANGAPLRDRRNPDAALRDRPICGMALLGGFTRDGNGSGDAWEGGTIYSAEDGETYSATMRLDAPDALRLRGYVGAPLFGATQRWRREAGPGGGC
ncbi:DUF2147 domain-containing protein [Rubrimonas cliftonensis]|nr:DUF2147 domain-containing protein [Rubrimonas cliftonensis]